MFTASSSSCPPFSFEFGGLAKRASTGLALALLFVFAIPAKAQMDSSQFVDISASSGLSQFEYTWGHAWGDPNGDGFPDVFVSNHYRIQDHNQPYLYLNQGDGTFLETYLPDYDRAPDMHGCGWFDFDNDGDEDLLVETGRTKRNYFLENLGGGLFVERAPEVGLDVPFVEGRSPLFIDQNRDGRLDVIHTAGVAIAPSLPPMLMSIQGDTGTYATLPEDQDANLAELSSTLGFLADLDEDGQLNAAIVTGRVHHWYETGCLPLRGAGQLDVDQTVEMVSGDFNGDLRSDLYVVRNDQGQSGVNLDYYTNFGVFYETDLIDPASLEAVSGPAFGTVHFDTLGTMTYTPLSGFVGSDSVEVGYCDVWDRCARSVVYFDVQATSPLPPLPGGDRYPTLQDSSSSVFMPLLVHPYRIQMRTILRPASDVHSFRFRVNSDSLFVVTGPPFLLPPGALAVGGSGYLPQNERGFLLRASDSANHGLPSVVPGSEIRCDIGYDPIDSTWTIRQNSTNNVFRLLLSVFTRKPCRIASTQGFDTVSVKRPDRLLLRGDQGFEDATLAAGLDFPNAAIAAAVGDFDNDMDLDIYLSNGLGDGNLPNILLDNQGDGHFIPVPGSAGAAGTSEGAAGPSSTADINRDGFLDLFIEQGRDPGNEIPGPYELFLNTGNANHWLEIDLEGRTSNRDGIGSSLICYAGGKAQLRVADAGLHRYAQNDAYLHFGLGGNALVDSLHITWPSGIEQTLYAVAADQVLRITEPDTVAPACFAPRGGRADVQGNRLLLQWRPVACATGYTVQWQALNDSMVFTRSTPDTAFAVPSAAVQPGKTYLWTVQAFCEDSTLGAISQRYSFRADAPCPAPGNPAVSLFLPDSAYAAWDPVANASSYDVFYKPSFRASFLRRSVNGERLDLPTNKLFPGSSYDWFVQAICPFSALGDSSAIQSISVPSLRDGSIHAASVFPNPAKDWVRFEWPGLDSSPFDDPLHWRVVHPNGVILNSGTLNEGRSLTIELSELPAGNYVLMWNNHSTKGHALFAKIP